MAGEAHAAMNMSGFGDLVIGAVVWALAALVLSRLWRAWIIRRRAPTSLSVGGRGATVNVGKRGVRTTVGLPGSGIRKPWQRPAAKPPSVVSPGSGSPIVGWFVVFFLVGVALAILFW